jgi:hypothetical protein
MTIAFVHNDKAFLPEMEAYSHFFSGYHIKCEVVTKKDKRRNAANRAGYHG